ncbi:synaptosomal-associated protein 29 isoform X2 [Ambystoma mexicanum]|uniref:synaptosomal-associated protein 29 isoform X2 n=1 Tax=Ambystoma mexicanum TaxID=8296 RepID=UPI0037E70F55
MSRSYNPFDEDEDDDFRSAKWREAPNFSDDPAESQRREAADGQRSLQQEVMRRAAATVESSDRCVSLIYESEKVGVDTAEELVRQGESLKRTERMVDSMEQDLKISQRHINNIKSVFGGLVNYFKPKPTEPPAPATAPECKPNNRLQDAVAAGKGQEANYQASHPNIRKLNTDEFSNNAASASSSSSQQHPKNQVLRDYHQKVDNNLGEKLLPQDPVNYSCNITCPGRTSSATASLQKVANESRQFSTR